PAAATMLLGTIAGEWLQRDNVTQSFKVKRLALAGALCTGVGLAWAFDLLFNKPRWTPCYLLWCTGIDFIVLAGLYWLIDIRRSRRWVYPFVVFGSNAIAAYFLPILFKVLFGNIPRVAYDGERTSVTNASILFLKNHLGAWAGGWMFTALFVIFWWLVLDQMYRRKLFWKL